jgi:hypothetical protein
MIRNVNNRFFIPILVSLLIGVVLLETYKCKSGKKGSLCEFTLAGFQYFLNTAQHSVGTCQHLGNRVSFDD